MPNYALDYKGPRDHLKNVVILYETSRWDGPLSGLCTSEGHLLWFKAFGEDLRIPYSDYEGLTPEEIEDFELFKDFGYCRGFQAFYLPDNILKKAISLEKEWEINSAGVWGMRIPCQTKEDEEEQKKFKEYIEKRKANKLKEKFKLSDYLTETNTIGYFFSPDIKENFRRLDKGGQDYLLGIKKDSK